MLEGRAMNTTKKMESLNGKRTSSKKPIRVLV
jgi:hypothetical protein